jgi:PII-like signaling protein
MAGFGRRHVLHESQFFELAGSLTVEVELIVSEDEAQLLLDLLRGARIRAFFVHSPQRGSA